MFTASMEPLLAEISDTRAAGVQHLPQVSLAIPSALDRATRHPYATLKQDAVHNARDAVKMIAIESGSIQGKRRVLHQLQTCWIRLAHVTSIAKRSVFKYLEGQSSHASSPTESCGSQPRNGPWPQPRESKSKDTNVKKWNNQERMTGRLHTLS
eukprot:jgi/Ulvmu1/4990/UM021_0007.1